MKKWIYRILMVLCLGVFGFSAYQLWTIFDTKQEVKKETEKYQKVVVQEDNSFDPDWESLRAQNPQIVAWLYVPDCSISFPVMQGEDNTYYLSHTVDGSYNAMGSFFLDAQATSNFTDDHSLIYGHSVEGGGMATALKNFSDPDFFSSHPVFYLFTPEAKYRCDIWQYSKTRDGSDLYITSFGDYKEESLQKMRQQALYTNEIEVDGPMVSISTCDLDYGFNSDRRLVLTGILHETEEPVYITE